MIRLFKRNGKGEPQEWSIYQDGNMLRLQYGLVGKILHRETVAVTKTKVNELESRVKAKRKEGYKELSELYDNSPSDTPRSKEEVMNGKDLYNYLMTYLPKNNTTEEGFVLPMLAKVLEDNKPFEKNGYMLGQWKINGLRCIVGAEKQNDMFNPIKLTYHSRTGEDWTPNMAWMDENILPYLSKSLVELMVDEGACLDGELYIPGEPVNMINSYVKNSSLRQHYELQYWCYDICVENVPAYERASWRVNNINRLVYTYTSKTEHLNNKAPFILLPTVPDVDSIDYARRLRDKFIKLGFEGLILRNPHAEYQFGKRNTSMFKYKKVLDGMFKIVDIREDKRGLPVYTLKNDLNDEYFESTINISQAAQKAQLQMRNELIGKFALVEYRERSGVKQVPFHAKMIKVYV